MRRGSIHISPAEFERLVEEALEQLPPQFQDLLDNVAVVVEDEPDDEDYEMSDTPDEHELLGIFRGIARTNRSWEQLPALPNQVAIFRGPILRLSRSRDEAVEEIRDTVIHELGHFFGLGDHDMPY
ncbi:MAG: metallopeptidase family protein [Thermoanaerobaculia bacterium]